MEGFAERIIVFMSLLGIAVTKIAARKALDFGSFPFLILCALGAYLTLVALVVVLRMKKEEKLGQVFFGLAILGAMSIVAL